MRHIQLTKAVVAQTTTKADQVQFIICVREGEKAPQNGKLHDGTTLHVLVAALRVLSRSCVLSSRQQKVPQSTIPAVEHVLYVVTNANPYIGHHLVISEMYMYCEEDLCPNRHVSREDICG